MDRNRLGATRLPDRSIRARSTRRERRYIRETQRSHRVERHQQSREAFIQRLCVRRPSVRHGLCGRPRQNGNQRGRHSSHPNTRFVRCHTCRAPPHLCPYDPQGAARLRAGGVGSAHGVAQRRSKRRLKADRTTEGRHHGAGGRGGSQRRVRG